MRQFKYQFTVGKENFVSPYEVINNLYFNPQVPINPAATEDWFNPHETPVYGCHIYVLDVIKGFSVK